MIDVKRYTQCDKCGFRNMIDASFCGHCGKPLANSRGNQGPEGQTLVPRENSQPVLQSHNTGIQNVAGDLQRVLEDFYNTRKAYKGNTRFWKAFDRHIHAYEVDEKISSLISQIEDVYLNGYGDMHAQRVAAMHRTRQQQLDYEHRIIEQEHNEIFEKRDFEFNQGLEDIKHRKDLIRRAATHQSTQNLKDEAMSRKLERFWATIRKIDIDCFEKGLLDGLPEDARKEMFFRLVQRAEKEIFSSVDEDIKDTDYLDELNDLV
ncbi:MAG: zinc ribbon domain-containing protein [Anaerolineales bacterium]|nr:zinc ribbon domain-containing protein [Anaerolineales bacterium]